MPDQLVLSEPAIRKLAVQWDTIRDNHKITDEQLSGYDLGRQWLLGSLAKPPRDMNLGGLNTSRPKRAAGWLGLDPSVRVAEAQFRGIDREYWSCWCSSGLGYEVYRDWLDSVTRQVSAELDSIWKGRSVVTDQWFDSTCEPAIKKALGFIVKRRIAQARDVETKRLERPSSKAHTGTGNPVADEILARANDPESMRRLIESGDDSLSPLAQRAVQLARTRMKGNSGGRERGKMTAMEFWRDMEARFRALQSQKVPVQGIPWHDDSLHADWLSSGWSDTGDQWHLHGADPTVRVKFEWLAERAAVELGQVGSRSGVVFWLDLLKRDSPNYRVRSGSGDGGVTRDHHGKIERVCEASADYCLKLETQDVLEGLMKQSAARRKLDDGDLLAGSSSRDSETQQVAIKDPSTLRPLDVERNTTLSPVDTISRFASTHTPISMSPEQQHEMQEAIAKLTSLHIDLGPEGHRSMEEFLASLALVQSHVALSPERQQEFQQALANLESAQSAMATSPEQQQELQKFAARIAIVLADATVAPSQGVRSDEKAYGRAQTTLIDPGSEPSQLATPTIHLKPEQRIGDDPAKNNHVELLQRVLDKRTITLEKWAKQNHIGRTTIFDWKRLRSAGKSLTGKVSETKATAIENAIEADAKALGLTIRTDSD